MGSSAEQSSLLRNLLLYGVIGCIAAGTDAVFFWLLAARYGIAPLRANLVSVPIGILVSFLLNRRFNFRVYDHPFKRGLAFFAVGLCGLGVSQLILWLGSIFELPAMTSKLISIFIVALFQFTLNKLISFGIKF